MANAFVSIKASLAVFQAGDKLTFSARSSHPVLYVLSCPLFSQKRSSHAQVIREAFRSELPIEVFYFGKEEEHVATLTALKVSAV